MRVYLALTLLAISSTSTAQNSEDLIPKDAVSVFSINNFSVLQKISMDELVKYEFMEEIQQELFDGSTHGKTIKDSGIDFDQKLNVFYGKGFNYEVSGFTFGIKNKTELFSVFDDFNKEESRYAGTEYYSSYFNHLIIKGNSGVLIRVEPNYDLVNQTTDSIWYARGNEYPWEIDWNWTEGEEYDPSMEDDLIEGEEEAEFYMEELIEDELSTENNQENAISPNWNEELLPEADVNPNEKTYFELRDSVETEMQRLFLKQVCDELFIHDRNLRKSDSNFEHQLQLDADGIFYLDNSRNFQKEQSFWYFKTMFPSLYRDLQELYKGNVMLGEIHLNNSDISVHMNALYGPSMGSIYYELNNAKFDKDALKYIHKDNNAYFTYNVNLRAAYEKAYDILVPMLSREKNSNIALNLLIIELLDELINKDALFGTYKGGMFGSFNGIKKVKTTKIEFTYDEETFEYSETTVEAEEDIPIFTLGFSTDRADIPEKILKRLSHLSSQFHNMGTYWQYDNAILNAVPLYMINKNGLFIFTNDEDLAKNHSGGYGSNGITGKKAKKIKKNGFMYSYLDWGKTVDELPREIFNERENAVIDTMRGKSGQLELTSSKTTTEKTEFDLVYKFEGDDSAKYILDLFNSIFVIAK